MPADPRICVKPTAYRDTDSTSSASPAVAAERGANLTSTLWFFMNGYRPGTYRLVSNRGISPAKAGLRLSERQFIAGEQAAQYQNTENHHDLQPRTSEDLDPQEGYPPHHQSELHARRWQSSQVASS